MRHFIIVVLFLVEHICCYSDNNRAHNTVDNDSILCGHPISFYINHEKIPQICKDLFNNVRQPSDEVDILSVLDSMFTSNEETKPFYFLTITRTMEKADGAYAEELVTCQTSYGQTGLRGHVTDRLDRTGFAGLMISLVQNDSTVTGTVTNQNGDYELYDLRPGTYNIKVKFLGYRERYLKDPIIISENKVEELNFIHPDSCGTSKKICPHGHTDSLVPIIYGLPDGRLMKKSKKGLVQLGGCIVTGCDPNWYCKKHKIEF